LLGIGEPRERQPEFTERATPAACAPPFVAAGCAVISVLLVGGVRLHREGIAALLRDDPRLDVAVGPASADALARAAAAVNVVVVDAADHDGLASVRRLAETGRPIVALGVPSDVGDVIAFAEHGALGFLEREASLEDLATSVLSAARGEASFPPRIGTALLRRVRVPSARPTSADAPLTVRERQIVDLIADGLSNKQIAARLTIEVATVKNHVHNILEKLQVSRRTDAVDRLRLVEGGASAPTGGIGSSVVAGTS
jgi:two-component system, NarL family, nitrate/nitrite response regulator NarL